MPDRAKRAPVKGKWAIFAGAVIGLSVLAGILSSQFPHFRKPAPKAASTAAPSRPTGQDLSFAGRIQSQQTINVPAPISGRIEAFHVEAGQEVFEGQLLAQIRSQSLSVSQEEADAALDGAQQRVNKLESEIIAARLEASRARADASRANAEYVRTQRIFQRQKMLLSEGATPKVTAQKSEKDFLSAEQEWNNLDAVAKGVEERVDALQKEHENARKILAQMQEASEVVKAQLAAGEVHSPVTGVVVGRRGEQGGSIDQSVRDFFAIAVDLTRLEFVAEAPNIDPRVKVGQPAAIHIAELAGETLPGAVSKLDAGRVTIEFNSPNAAIKPGLTAQAVVHIQ